MAEINKDPEPKICESCGEAFGCGAKLDGCWCVSVAIEPDVTDGLKAKYNDCLCPKCLTNAALASEDNEHQNV